MSTSMPAESRRLYSWWWDSHSSPKNSKWLQENLTDMDLKVKAMIKLIEEDADSFTRRAEMYYKKRPELMKFVEDFYRAYRALAERYNHATSALSHAHRTIAEVFPNHIPLVIPGESPSISSGTEAGPCTPEITSPLCLLFDHDDLQKDALSMPGYFHSNSRNVGYIDDASFAIKKGLKQLNEMFATQEGAPRMKLYEGKVRKSLNFIEEEECVSHSEIHTVQPQSSPGQEIDDKENAKKEIKHLQEDFSQLSIENKKLIIQIESESSNSELFRIEVQDLRDAITKLESEKKTIFLQDKIPQERMLIMENEIFRAKYEFGKLHEDIIMGTVRLCSAEEQCLLLEDANHSLILELQQCKKSLEEIRLLSVDQDNMDQEVKEKENAKHEMNEQLSLISCENCSLKTQLQNETVYLQLFISEVHNMRETMSKLESEKEAVVLQCSLLWKSICSLESENFQAKDEIEKLHVGFLMGIVKLCSAEEKYFALKKEGWDLKLELEERKNVLEEIQKLSVESQIFLEQEIMEKENIKNEMECLQRDISHLLIENQNLKSQIVSKSKILSAYSTEIQNLRNANSILECEKKDVVLENQLSRESINSLGSEIFRAKEEIRNLHAEVFVSIVKSCSEEEQNLALESVNNNMKLEVKKNKERVKGLRISLKESDKQRVEAERSLQSWERLYNLSEEKVEHMTFEIQTYINRLHDIEHSKMSLEEEVHQIKDVNCDLNDCILAYNSKLEHLQVQIVSLNAINCKLEDEINLHLDDNKVLQQQVDCIMDDRNQLDIKHKNLIEQLEVASLNMESLEILVKELQFGCADLSEGCQKLEDEKLLLFNKVQDAESICEKNAVLKNSLSDAMEKIRVLEDSCGSFNTKNSILIAEKAAVASQIGFVIGNMEKLSEKNTILENSIVDLNTELEDLQLKMEELKESNQLLSKHNSNLLAQNSALVSQVGSTQYDLTNLKTEHAMLEINCLNLEKENDVSICQISELQVALEVKKKEYESLLQTSASSLLSLEHQIHFLHEDGRFKDEELEIVHQNCMGYIIVNLILHICLSDIKGSFIIEKQQQEFLNQSSELQLVALESQVSLIREKGHIRDEEFEEEYQKYITPMLENFFLQRCLSEVKEKNFILSQSFLQLMEASRCASDLISQLEGSKLYLKEKNTLPVQHNARLVQGTEILLEPFSINKKLTNTDENEVFIQTINVEVNNQLAYISDVDVKNQLLHNELSVYQTFLEQISLEKVFLGQELGRMGGQLLVFQRDQDQLLERCEILGQDVNDKKQLNESLKSELESLCRLLSEFSMYFSNLSEEKNALEEEYNVIIEEAMALEHLYLFFRSSNTVSLHLLKTLDDEIVSLCSVKHVHEKEIIDNKERIKVAENERKMLMELHALLEELRSRIIILEFDLFTARFFNEDFIHQVETGENLLNKKSTEVMKAYNKLQCTQEEVTELCTGLEAAKEEVDEAEIMRMQFEGEVAVLLEVYTYKELEIANTCEENRMLNEELNKLNGKVEVLRKSEHSLSSALQSKVGELNMCEEEIMNLFNEVLVSAINNAVFEEKMFGWAISSEVLEICALVQREILNERIALTNSYAFELKKKLVNLENENGELKVIWSSCLRLFISLQNGITNVEKQAYQLANLHEDQDIPLTYPWEENVNEARACDIVNVAGALELQSLIPKIKALDKFLGDTSNQLKHEWRLHASNLEAARREIERLNMDGSDQDEKSGTSRAKHGKLTKDIELDDVSNSNVLSRIQSAESEDQMLKLWETAEDCISGSNLHDIEPVEEELNISLSSSKLTAEKEVGVGKLGMSTKESREEWNRRVIGRLSADAKRLFSLKSAVKELGEKMDRHVEKKHRNGSELDAMHVKVKRAEKEILELVDFEEKLKNKVEDYSKSCDSNEMMWSDRMQVFEQARMVLDRVEKLAMELQEFYFFFVNLGGRTGRNKARERDRSPRVLLRDYMDGWRAGKARKKVHLCGCMRPNAEE